MQGPWNGVILTLSFKDANNNIVHVASAVCRNENAESYVYLLENAKKFEPLGAVLNSETMTCFADGLKGSEVGLFASCPLTEDRRCLEHMLRSIPDVGKVREGCLGFLGRCSCLGTKNTGRLCRFPRISRRDHPHMDWERPDGFRRTKVLSLVI